MTKTEYCVSAEDVMALLDGEFSAADARAISAHIEECSDCALVMEQLRGVSEALSKWNVPEVPTAVDHSVEERLKKLRVGRRTTRVRFSPRKPWVIGGGCAVALAMLLLVAFLNRPHGPRELSYTVVEPEAVAKYKRTPLPDRKYPTAPNAGQATSGAIAGVAGMGGATLGAVDATSPSMLAPRPSMIDATPPMIARTMSLMVLVKDVEAARGSLDSILTRHHGYSAFLNMSAPEDGPRSVRASLRVPANELAPAVTEVRALGRVVNESQSGEEVSQQHADLVARLKTARETEARFQAILAERTGKISDVLEVEQSIARVRGEIEQMEAEQKTLEHRVDFATVEVQLAEEYKARLESPAATSVSTRMHNAFVAGYHNATESLLELALFAEEYGPPVLMWLAILGVPAVVLWRRYKKMRGAL